MPETMTNEQFNESKSTFIVLWVESSKQLPPEDVTVLVNGGVAFHDGERWLSVTGEAWPGRQITWDVDYWAPIPSPPRY